MLSPVSPWMGDRLGTLDAVGFSLLPFLFLFSLFWYLRKRLLMDLSNLLLMEGLLTLKNFYSLGTLNFPTLNSFEELFELFDAKHSNVTINGEVSQSLRYCNTRPTRETSVASN